MSSNFLSFEHEPDVLVVNVKGQWIFDEVLALEEAVATVNPDNRLASGAQVLKI